MNDFQNIIGSFTMTYFGNENSICYIYIYIKSFSALYMQ